MYFKSYFFMFFLSCFFGGIHFMNWLLLVLVHHRSLPHFWICSIEQRWHSNIPNKLQPYQKSWRKWLIFANFFLSSALFYLLRLAKIVWSQGVLVYFQKSSSWCTKLLNTNWLPTKIGLPAIIHDYPINIHNKNKSIG